MMSPQRRTGYTEGSSANSPDNADRDAQSDPADLHRQDILGRFRPAICSALHLNVIYGRGQRWGTGNR